MTPDPATPFLRGRLAPTPTGRMHLGNMRTFLLTWLQARRAGGTVVLRMEDIDRQRSRDEFVHGIYEDLRWLGLDWDEGPDVGGPHGPYVQSQRYDMYRDLLCTWDAQGRVYPCVCSRKDLRLAGAPHVGEEGPYYPGICRDRPRIEGVACAYRFRVEPNTVIRFNDKVLGYQEQRVAEQTGDFVVWRKDDWPSYQLAVVADDAAMGITDVMRGADLLSSVGRQTLLFQALDKEPPRWHHVPMWLDEQGGRLAKRSGSLALASLRAEGLRPEAVLAHIARSLGWDVPTQIALDELMDRRFQWSAKGHV